MYLFYCDESNIEARSGDFFLYAGIAIPADNALALSQSIESCLAERNIARDYKLKFNPGPQNLNHPEFIALKRDVINSATQASVKLMLYMVLHDIAKNPDEARRNGINYICFHFDCFLKRVKNHGLVLVDRFTDKDNRIEAHLTEKFAVGLKNMPYKKEIRLNNIIGFHYSSIGQSHFPSLIDVIVGSLRFAVNALTRDPKHLDSARKILKLISPLFYREDSSTAVSEIGLILSPKIINVKSYQEKYQSLKDFFAEAEIVLSQPITQDRQY